MKMNFLTNKNIKKALEEHSAYVRKLRYPLYDLILEDLMHEEYSVFKLIHNDEELDKAKMYVRKQAHDIYLQNIKIYDTLYLCSVEDVLEVVANETNQSFDVVKQSFYDLYIRFYENLMKQYDEENTIFSEHVIYILKKMNRKYNAIVKKNTAA